MSYFLHYFEKNNPDATWEDYSVKSDTILFSFSSSVKGEDVLLIEESELNYEHYKYQSYIISDGISSDKLFQNKTMKDDFLGFLKSRILIKKNTPCFTLMLHEKKSFDHVMLDSDVEIIYSSLVDLEEVDKLEYDKLYILRSENLIPDQNPKSY